MTGNSAAKDYVKTTKIFINIPQKELFCSLLYSKTYFYSALANAENHKFYTKKQEEKQYKHFARNIGHCINILY